MKRIVMTIEQIQTMVAKADGYDTREEWLEDAEAIGYWNPYSIICIVGECANFGFCKDGVTRWYTFEDYKGRPCIYFRH